MIEGKTLKKINVLVTGLGRDWGLRDALQRRDAESAERSAENIGEKVEGIESAEEAETSGVAFTRGRCRGDWSG